MKHFIFETCPMCDEDSTKSNIWCPIDDQGFITVQCDNCGFSAPVGFCRKAQCAVNGWSFTSAVTQWRKPTGAPCGLTGQCPWTSLHLLARTKAITCKVRLAMNTDKPTASVIITLTEH